MLQRAIAAYNAAVQRMNDLVDQVNDAPEDADITDDVREDLNLE